MKAFFTMDDPVVPANHPRALVDVAVLQGAPRDAVVAAAGLSYEALLDPDLRISYGQYLALADAGIRLTGNPALGLDFGAQARLAHWGVLGLAAMNGVNAAEALRLALQYYRSFAPGWDLSVEIEDGVGRFIARETIPRGHLRPFATEAMLVTMDRLITEAVGQRPPAREVRLPYPRPDYADKYDRYFVGHVVFDSTHAEVLFDPSTMGTPIVGADPSIAVIAERYCIAEAARADATDGLLGEVRKILLRGLTPRPTLEDVARELRTSSRSLRRGLREMDTSFRALLEEASRARAEELVRQTSEKLEHIAAELGFSDVRTFRRAFKRWTGHSPAAFRDRHRRA